MNNVLGTVNSTQSTESKRTFLLMVLVGFACAVQVISGVIAGKLIALPFGLSCPGGSLVFPVMGVLMDIMSNCYGSKIVKKVTIISVIANIFMALMFTLCIALPAPIYIDSNAYATVLTQSARNVIAGLLALYFSQILNSVVLQKMKKRQIDKGISTTNRKGIFARAYVSSIPATFVDSTIFVVLAFIGTVPLISVLIMIVCQSLVKLGTEAIIQTPVSAFLIPKIVNWSEADAVDSAA